jgi:hypothetical protein
LGKEKNMGFLLILTVLAYLTIGALILSIVRSLTGSQKAVWFATGFLLLGPFWRPLFCSLYFALFIREPLQEIYQTVEYPESVYWQDDVWPGFDDYGRRWMVEQYLDGIHLKILAMNGDDGKIYLYRAEREMFIDSENIKEKMSQLDSSKNEYSKLHENYMRIKKATVDKITTKVEMINSPLQLPPIHYNVHFAPLDNWWRDRGIYHADQITIINSTTKGIVAYSRRYMPFANWLMKLSGNQPIYAHGPGGLNAYEFDDKILFGYAKVNSSYESKRNNLRR